jgi:hypothetical protein
MFPRLWRMPIVPVTPGNNHIEVNTLVLTIAITLVFTFNNDSVLKTLAI